MSFELVQQQEFFDTLGPILGAGLEVDFLCQACSVRQTGVTYCVEIATVNQDPTEERGNQRQRKTREEQPNP